MQEYIFPYCRRRDGQNRLKQQTLPTGKRPKTLGLLPFPVRTSTKGKRAENMEEGKPYFDKYELID